MEHGMVVKSRKTPEQERAAAQAYAQRDGFVIGFVRGYMTKNGGVCEVDMEQGRREAKGRFPIFGMRRRVVEDADFRYKLSEDGETVLIQPKVPTVRGVFRNVEEFEEAYRAEVDLWFAQRLLALTPERIRLLAKLLQDPDEVYQTGE